MIFGKSNKLIYFFISENEEIELNTNINVTPLCGDDSVHFVRDFGFPLTFSNPTKETKIYGMGHRKNMLFGSSTF